jgi:PHP family Zn ribbon phosphoesterase
MKHFRADLHIHTVLSACADLEMSPVNIVKVAKARKLDMIGITDHNSTLHCNLVQRLAWENGLALLLGVEVTTREEVHCLAYFPDMDSLELFQQYLEQHLPKICYNPEQMGYQALVDRDDRIIRLVEEYLNVALDQGIDQVSNEVHKLGGIFVPAHIERPMYGIVHQLGFIPEDLNFDGLGIMRQSNESDIRKKLRLSNEIALIKASDAHAPEEIGTGTTIFELEEPTFQEINMALHGIDGRKIIVA